MNGALSGLAALVTGGSGAIGSASALALLRDGASVLLMARGQDALERTRDTLLAQVPDGRVGIMAGDGCVEADVAAATAAAAAMTGRLDILVATVARLECPDRSPRKRRKACATSSNATWSVPCSRSARRPRS